MWVLTPASQLGAFKGSDQGEHRWILLYLMAFYMVSVNPEITVTDFLMIFVQSLQWNPLIAAFSPLH